MAVEQLSQPMTKPKYNHCWNPKNLVDLKKMIHAGNLVGNRLNFADCLERYQKQWFGAMPKQRAMIGGMSDRLVDRRNWACFRPAVDSTEIE